MKMENKLFIHSFIPYPSMKRCTIIKLPFYWQSQFTGKSNFLSINLEVLSCQIDSVAEVTICGRDVKTPS